MESSIVSRRGQTVVPAAIRRQLQIEAGDRIVWIFDGRAVQIVRIPDDPIAALEGSARGENLVENLLLERRLDREREERKLG